MPGSEKLELSTECWSRVISYLVRKTPAVYEPAEWEDLHQHDLTVVSRVSTTFHELAIDHLYRDVVTDDLPALFRHLDDDPSFLASKVTSKRRRLERIKRLRVSINGPPSHRQGVVAHVRDLRGMTIGRARFPSLEHFIIGQKSNSRPIRFLQEQISFEAMSVALSLGPKVICIYDPSYEPYEIAHLVTPAADRESMVVNHHVLDFSKTLLMPGLLNRHIVHPGSGFLEDLAAAWNHDPEDPEDDLEGSEDEMSAILWTIYAGNMGNGGVRCSSDTRNEVYGFYRLPSTQTGGRPAREVEDERQQQYSPQMLELVPPHLLPNTSFRSWDDSPDCPACGWSLKCWKE